MPDLPGLRHAVRGAAPRARPRRSAKSKSSARRNGSRTTTSARLSRMPGPAAQSARARGAAAARARARKSTAGSPSARSARFPSSRRVRFFRTVKPKGREARIARDILPEIVQRLEFLVEVGLGYLSLDRSADHAFRRRIAAHPARGAIRLRAAGRALRPRRADHRPASPRQRAAARFARRAARPSGNTLVVVEHDEDTMRFADRIIDLGPGAGTQGGQIVAEGPWKTLASHGESPTGKILGKPLRHPLRGQRRPVKDAPDWCRVVGAHANNLKQIDVALPGRPLHRALRRQRRGQKHAAARRDQAGGAGLRAARKGKRGKGRRPVRGKRSKASRFSPPSTRSTRRRSARPRAPRPRPTSG